MINEYVQKISGVFLRFSRHFRIFMFIFFMKSIDRFYDLRDNFIIKTAAARSARDWIPVGSVLGCRAEKWGIDKWRTMERLKLRAYRRHWKS